MFNVRILGTGAAIPTLKRGTTSHFVNCQQRSILIDCGEGTQIQMRRFNVKYQNIQIVLISHLHGDHVLGLPGLIGTMQLLGRTKPMTIIGPEGIQELLTSLFKWTKSYNSFPIHYVCLEPKEQRVVYEDKCIKINAFPLKHKIPAHGFRIDEKPGKRHLNKEAFDQTKVSVSYIEKLLSGKDIEDNNGVVVKWEDVTFPPSPTKSYAFCSDTAFHLPIIDAVQNVDLLYHEATFIDKDADRAVSTFHSTAKQAASIALKSNVKRLVLGHFSARYNNTEIHLKEAKEIFDNVYIPEDGAFFEL